MGKSKKQDKQKLKKKSKKDHKKKLSKSKKEKLIEDVEQTDESFAIPLELMNNKSHAPETPEEYKKRQSQLRRITDPVSGRIRLIRGDGEVLEEIVSKKQHESINKAATEGDGNYFASKTTGSKGLQIN